MRPSLSFLAVSTALLAALGTPSAAATPTLHCAVTYAGSTQTLRTLPVADPYPVPSVDVGGRFRFKAVMVGEGTRLEYIKLYAYQETPLQPVLMQQATYLPPFPPGGTLTGKQFLYASPVERELQYECQLHGVQP